MQGLVRPLAALAGRALGRRGALPDLPTGPSDIDVRREIGDRVLQGHGYEFGAGLLPSCFAKVAGLTVIDKRTPGELAALFGQRPDYAVLALEAAAAQPPADFVTAHHVVEHLPNPIGTLAAWLPLLRVGGVLYLSVPSSSSPYERLREVTPISHLVLDHLLDADGADFDSRQHIQSFIQQWTVVSPESFWFTRDGVQAYAEASLSEQRRTEGHDLHWHTYNLDTFKQVVEAAFFVAGAGMSWGETRETDEALYVVAHKAADPPRKPACVAEVSARLQARLATLA